MLFVVFCRDCNSIVGNSSDFITSWKDMVSFEGLQNYKKFDGFCFSESGSSFVEVICSCCRVVLGRSYCITTKDEDFLRHLFWLYPAKLSVYILEECKIQTNAALFLEERSNENESVTKELSEAISSAQATLVSLEKRINILAGPNAEKTHKSSNSVSKKRVEPIPVSPIHVSETEETKQEIEDTQSDEEIDLSKFGSSESAVWGDGWKLSLQWVKKHPPYRVPKKRDCIVCNARCVMKCQICDVHLHTRNACYAKYHMNPEKYDQKPTKKGHVCKACGKPRKGHPGKPGLKHCIFANK